MLRHHPEVLISTFDSPNHVTQRLLAEPAAPKGGLQVTLQGLAWAAAGRWNPRARLSPEPFLIFSFVKLNAKLLHSLNYNKRAKISFSTLR